MLEAIEGNAYVMAMQLDSAMLKMVRACQGEFCPVRED